MKQTRRRLFGSVAVTALAVTGSAHGKAEATSVDALRDPPLLEMPHRGELMSTAMRKVHRNTEAAMAWIKEAVERVERAST